MQSIMIVFAQHKRVYAFWFAIRTIWVHLGTDPLLSRGGAVFFHMVQL